MEYLITFLEGVISFISPCMLPMLPVYVSYFAGGGGQRHKVLLRAVCFVLGFTLIFSLLGLFAGTLGGFLSRYRTAVNVISGGIVVLLGLSYLEVIPLPFFQGMKEGREITDAVSALVFGMIYSVSLTPCVGAFLGSALMLASASGTAVRGVTLLVVYSLGLGVPFILSAMLLEQLETAFRAIKRHYRVINAVCGGFLILVGIAMAMGWMSRLMAVFS